jgi:hypothetical protein
MLMQKYEDELKIAKKLTVFLLVLII